MSQSQRLSFFSVAICCVASSCCTSRNKTNKSIFTNCIENIERVDGNSIRKRTKSKIPFSRQLQNQSETPIKYNPHALAKSTVFLHNVYSYGFIFACLGQSVLSDIFVNAHLFDGDAKQGGNNFFSGLVTLIHFQWFFFLIVLEYVKIQNYVIKVVFGITHSNICNMFFITSSDGMHDSDDVLVEFYIASESCLYWAFQK